LAGAESIAANSSGAADTPPDGLWQTSADEATKGVPNPALPTLPEARVAKRWQWSNWAIWLIPLLAALVALGIILQTLSERGGKIVMEFKSAEGLEPAKTKIKYKDVEIGEVKTIALSDDRQKVLVTAELTKGSANLMHKDTVFWIVRPRIGVGGISGLSTLLSGSYIGVDVGKSNDYSDYFIGLDAPPPILNDYAGRTYVLHAEQIGSLDIGAPVYFRHIQVGQVISYELDKQGRGVSLKIFVNAPYDKYVQAGSLFWHASGVEVSVDANGFKVQTESVATVVAGGISFDTLANDSMGNNAGNSAGNNAGSSASSTKQALINTEFQLFANRQKALQRPDTEVRRIRMYFEQSVRGLLQGAPVDFRGIVIGEVQSVGLEYDPKTRRYRFPVEANLYPQRLNNPGAARQDSEQLLHRLFDQGLRAQLKTGNLLTGALYVGLDFFPEAHHQALNWKQQPLVVGTMPGALDELQTSLVSIAKKLDSLPLADLTREVRAAITDLRGSLQGAEKLMTRFDQELTPQATATLAQARKTLASVETTLADDSPLQQDARASLRELQKAAESVRHLAETLERHPESLLRGKPEDAP
jgi:paraquat-inducible protein B